MIHIVVLNFGYVESTVAGHLFFRSEDGHDTRFGALRHLAHALYDKYRASFASESMYDLKKCCKTNKSTANYCAKCGRDFSKGYGLDWSRYCEWLNELLTIDCDSFAECDAELEDWDLWTSIVNLIDDGRDKILYIPELGNEHLIRALDVNQLHEFDRKSYTDFVEKGLRRWFYDQPQEVHIEQDQLYRV